MRNGLGAMLDEWGSKIDALKEQIEMSKWHLPGTFTSGTPGT